MKAPPKFPLWPQDWQTLRSSTLVRAVGGGVIGAQSLAGSIAQDNVVENGLTLTPTVLIICTPYDLAVPGLGLHPKHTLVPVQIRRDRQECSEQLCL